MVNVINRLQPKTIIYISCNPSSLARDIDLFKQGGYEIKYIQPLDMFPQTTHVETIIKMIK